MRYANRMIVLVLLVSGAACADHATEPARPSRPLTGANDEYPARFRVFAKSARFRDTLKYTAQGIRQPGGACAWQGEEKLARGQRVAERVAAYDPNTCELIIARGEYVPRLRPEGMSSVTLPIPRSTLLATCGSNPNPCNGDPMRCEPTTVDFGRAWQMIQYMDPVEIETTQDQVDLSWNYNWQCVGEIHGYHYMAWRVATGWDIQTWNTSATYDWNLYWVRAEGYSFYFNGSFCKGAGTVFANHRRNWVTGYKDGGASFSWLADVDGAWCKDMLHLHVVRETPV